MGTGGLARQELERPSQKRGEGRLVAPASVLPEPARVTWAKLLDLSESCIHQD